ncbi:MAG TPA: glycosyltransferase [Opitutaceae bacterium]|nr:glycosyltransferase [Opitutaceae bacterium]
MSVADSPAGAARLREQMLLAQIGGHGHATPTSTNARLAATLTVHPPRPPFLSPPRTSAALNVLIVLPGDFDSNSALHVVALTRHLAAAGHSFAVVAEHRFSNTSEPPFANLAALGDVSFSACTHVDATARLPVFPDGRAAEIVHAWTTRDNVRKVCESAIAATGAPLIVHLEDNEAHILARTLARSIEELRNLSPAEAEALLPWNLSHPGFAERFLARAEGATLIIDRLKDFLPSGMPSITLWPAADERYFFPRPRPDAFREALGFDAGHTVLFYHGNVHAANVVEMRALYEAVAVLNETGTPTTLIRTGANHCPFPGDLAPRVAGCVLELGRIKHHRHLPDLMALADFFVQPGTSDSFNDYRFPSKLPEFFSIGRPVILPRTNLGTAVTHGHDAYVLDRADAAGIAGAIRTLRGDPQLAARLARGAIEFAASHFDWSRSAALLEEFYRSVAGRASR